MEHDEKRPVMLHNVAEGRWCKIEKQNEDDEKRSPVQPK